MPVGISCVSVCVRTAMSDMLKITDKCAQQKKEMLDLKGKMQKTTEISIWESQRYHHKAE